MQKEENSSVPIPDFAQILTNPILDIGARFWDDERYKAFKVCYRSMRAVDDLVDNRKSADGKISEEEKERLSSKIKELISNGSDMIQIGAQLKETREKFHIPFWPWEKLCRSMVYDVYHNGFKTFQAFLEYTEGAAAAPASIFMHLCGAVNEKGNYKSPSFDIMEIARPIARFCYLVHIIRDFQKDQLSNLNYFADDILAEYGLTTTDLKEMASSGNITPEFRKMLEKYRAYAEEYKKEARASIDKVSTFLEPRYLLSLEVIFSLYCQIFERIDVQNGIFTSEELNPLPEEVKKRIDLTVSSF
jgi:phytoene synthase